MKKKALSAFLSLLLLGVTSCTGEKTYSVSDYGKSMAYHDDFTILQWTDIHLGIESDTSKVQEVLDLELDDIQSKKGRAPELIVITGDTFLNAEKSTVDWFFSYLDEKNIPFAFTYGNHDFQGSYSNDYIGKVISEKKNAVFVDYPDDSISGWTNYYIDLTEKDSTKYRLFIVDSNSYYQQGLKIQYDIIHKDQLAHIDDIVKEKGKVPSLAFYHIPVYEFDDAYKDYQAGKMKGTGTNEEKVAYGYQRTDAFTRMKEDGVIGMFCGHDHINNSSLLYQDVLLSYGMKSTYEIYNDEVGYTLIHLHGQETFALDDIEKVVVGKGEQE